MASGPLIIFLVFLVGYGNCATPTGCTYVNQPLGSVQCDFKLWSPPLNDSQFSPTAPKKLSMTNVNGAPLPPAALTSLASLDVLDLSNAALTHSSLPSWLSGVQASGLKELLLSGNYLNHTTGLTNPFGSFSSLDILDLSSTELASVPQTLLTGLKKLTRLSLHNNQLKTVAQAAFSDLTSMTNLRLDGNPFECNCNLAWLPDWILRLGITATPEALCATPVAHHSQTLKVAMYSAGCYATTASQTPSNTGNTGNTGNSTGNSTTAAGKVMGSVVLFGYSFTYTELGAMGGAALSLLVSLLALTAACCIGCQVKRMNGDDDDDDYRPKKKRIRTPIEKMRVRPTSDYEDYPPPRRGEFGSRGGFY